MAAATAMLKQTRMTILLSLNAAAILIAGILIASAIWGSDREFRAVDERKPTVYFSLHESNVQVVNRLIAIQTGIDHEKIVSGQLADDEWALLDQKLPALLDAPLYVDDTPMMTVAYLKEKLAGLKDKGVDLAVIDHAQMMNTQC